MSRQRAVVLDLQGGAQGLQVGDLELGLSCNQAPWSVEQEMFVSPFRWDKQFGSQRINHETKNGKRQVFGFNSRFR